MRPPLTISLMSSSSPGVLQHRPHSHRGLGQQDRPGSQHRVSQRQQEEESKYTRTKLSAERDPQATCFTVLAVRGGERQGGEKGFDKEGWRG